MTDWFTISEIDNQVYAISEFQHSEEVSSYLVMDGDQAVLFDTGMGFESITEAVRQITSLPIKVFLTHAHWDHIGGCHEFEHVSVYKHPFEESRLRSGYDISGHLVKGITRFQTVADLEVIPMNSFSLQVIHTPGHSPGSVCYLLPEKRLLVAGDLVYKGPIYLFLPESNLEEYRRSITKLMQYHSSFDVILPGHNSVREDAILLTQFAEALDHCQIQKGEAYEYSEFSFRC